MARGIHGRRKVILAGGGAAAIAAIGASKVFGQVPGQIQPGQIQPQLKQLPSLKSITPRVNLPQLQISRLTTALGSTGAWGEVQVRELPSGLVPVFVRTSNRAGVMDLTKTRGIVALANGAILLTSGGIQIGSTKQPWNAATVKDLLTRARNDVGLRNSLFELRSALVTAYPHAVSSSKRAGDLRSARAVVNMAKGMGASSSPRKSNCTSKTVVETVEEEVVSYVEEWLSAEDRFDKCVKDQVKAGIIGGEAAAMLYCGAIGFVDLFLGMLKVVSTIVKEVEHTVTTCVLDVSHRLVDAFKGVEISLPKGITYPGIAGAAPALSNSDITAAIGRLKDLLDSTSPYINCLLGGQWSFAAADLSVITGTKAEIPYGVKVCISSACARALRLDKTLEGLGGSATSLLAILAALSPEFAALAATLGIPAAAEAAAIAAALGATATVALTAVAALLLFLIYYAAMISLQMQFLPDEFLADGMVCIEHPTFVIAAVTLIVPVVGSLSQYTPPIVTG